uniref:Protein Wnt n=1 Tax=Halisarca dujardinii TaxID=2583056 RepID=A0A175BVP7_HALDU
MSRISPMSLLPMVPVLALALVVLAGPDRAVAAGNTRYWALYHEDVQVPLSHQRCSELQLAGVLAPSQHLLCVNRPQVLRAVVRGLQRAVHYCQHTFRDSPWDCPLDAGSNRGYLFEQLQKSSTPESGYLRAAVASSIIYEIAADCRQGFIPNCPCGSVHKFIELLPNGTRIIGGCDVNIHHAATVAEPFLGAGLGAMATREAVDHHNTELGKLIGSSTEKYCRCHGLSASCSIKVCHQKLSSFKTTHPEILHTKYRQSQLVKSFQQGTLISTNQDAVTAETMAHLDPSVNSCHMHSTVGKQCDSIVQCRQTCCSSQYTERTVIVSMPICRLVMLGGVFRNTCVVTGTRMATQYTCQ